MHDKSQDSSMAVVSDGVSKAFQANDLIVIDVLPIIETAVLRLEEMKTRPGDCISSIVHGYKYEGVMLTEAVTPKLQDLHVQMLDSTMDQIGSRFKEIEMSPHSDISVLDYRTWPIETKDLALHGSVNIDNIVQHFAPVLTIEEIISCFQGLRP